MALVIHLKKGQQLIVNGAVLENAAGRTISLLLKNNAAVLRQDDVLSPDNAATPASRTYYELQCAYLFPDLRDQHLQNFNDLLESYLEAAPSAQAIAEDIRAALEEDRLYAALKRAQALIRHEGEVLSNGQQQTDPLVQEPAAAGEPTRDRSVGAEPSCAQAERRRTVRG